MPKHHPKAALSGINQHKNRLTLPIRLMSNKFALSDIMRYAEKEFSVVLVSWVDSAEIASLALEISI